jgi:hypothetical protein
MVQIIHCGNFLLTVEHLAVNGWHQSNERKITMATKAKKAAVVIDAAKKVEQEKHRARTNLSSSINAAAVIEAYSKSVFGEQQGDLMALYNELSDSIDRVWDGDLKKCEAMLLAQASALQSIFTNLARRAIAQDGLNQFDTFLRLGLKAQGQAVRTIEALVEMKNPRSVAFVKQANIANNQQVNNGQTLPAQENEIKQNKLSGGSHELLTDTRASQAASRVNQTLETMGAKHGAEIG